jgi:hypothetical protein
MKKLINHPMADMVSIINHQFAYATENSSELAFFSEGEWVVKPIPEFAEFHDGSPEDFDTACYPYVPNELIEKFLEEYS